VSGLRLAVDIGGTFTDLVAFDEATGAVTTAKALSTPRDFAQGVLDTIAAGEVDAAAVAALVHGNTVVINAITEHSGARTALVTTVGFRDVLEIGRGNRPDMYNLRFHKPVPFVPRRWRFEVRERVAFDGSVRTPLHAEDLDTVVEACRRDEIEAVAICFLHSYAHPAHEAAAATYLRERLPGLAISASHEVTKEWREFERSSTVVLNAYVQPVLDRYLSNLATRLRDCGVGAPLQAMLSNGGTATFDAARRQPIQLVESGPAGGITGVAYLGALIGEPNLITLDIGGTTAKCSLLEGGEPRITTDYRAEWSPLSPGYPIRVPVVDIVEIGAGGGSIAWFDEGGALRVGPRSAGADPGPACYGRGGGEPTVTDAMLIAGVLDPDYFLGGRLRVEVDLARAAYAPIAERLGVSIEEAAAGVVRLLNEHTVDALKLVSVRRGFDPREFTLVAYGGGGPMHAAALAAEIGVRRVVIPPDPGTFSAWGMLATPPRVDLARTRVVRLDGATSGELDATFAELEREAIAHLRAQGHDVAAIPPATRTLDMRYKGQEHTVLVPLATELDGSLAPLAEAFHKHHERRYTFALADTPIEIVSFRVTSIVQTPRPTVGAYAATDDAGPSAKGVRMVDHFGTTTTDRRRLETPVFERANLPVGVTIAGPALVEEPSATTLVHPGQSLAVDRWLNLVIEVGRSS
jgi:N-methylhydantoinase A